MPPASSEPPLRAAMVRFTTLDPARWGAVCNALAELGFDAIDLPLVWREHEAAREGGSREGAYDFASRERSLRAMCEAIRAAGLQIVFRPGPLGTDDAPALGVPDRVLYDRACQARTRRQNPVLVPDPPRAIPTPSFVSRAFRAQARSWVTAATRALLEATDRGAVARVVLGPGPHAVLRDDPFEFDYHPDGHEGVLDVLPPHELDDARSLEAIDREARTQVSFRDELAEALHDGGLVDARVFVSVPGAVTVSPAAHALARRYGLCVACPPSIAGTAAIWRQVRYALALGAPHGVHLEAWAGAPWYYPPTRGSHSVAAARVALAAGARDATVRMGCAAGRWIGAVLADDGSPRDSTRRWRELLAWWGTLTAGDEPSVQLEIPRARVRAARVATGVHPAPLGLLGLLGLAPEEIATANAKLPVREDGVARSESDALDRLLEAHEQAVWGAGVACARVPGREPSDGASAASVRVVPSEGEEPGALAQRALDELRAWAPVIDPPGAALVRVVRDAHREQIFVVSRGEGAARVTPPDPQWEPSEPVVLEPGSVQVFTRPRPAGDTREHAARERTDATHTSEG